MLRRHRRRKAGGGLRRQAKAPDTRLPASLRDALGLASGGGARDGGGGAREGGVRDRKRKRSKKRGRSPSPAADDAEKNEFECVDEVEPTVEKPAPEGKRKRARKRKRPPETQERKESTENAPAEEDPDKKEIRRLEKLLGISKKRKKAAEKGEKFSYASAFAEDEKDLADLVDICSGGLADASDEDADDGLEDLLIVPDDPADELDEEGDEEAVIENSGSDSDASGDVEMHAETEDGDDGEAEDKDEEEVGSGSSDDTDANVQEDGKSSAKAQPEVSSGRKTPSLDEPNSGGAYLPPSRRAGAGSGAQRLGRRIRALLNRLAEANAGGIASSLEELFKSPGPGVSQITATSLYANATLDAIRDGSAIAGLSPFVTPHAVIVSHLGATIDVRVLAEVLVGVVRRVETALPTLVAQNEEEELLIGARAPRPVFGYVALLGALYRRRAASAQIIHELVRALADGQEAQRVELLLALFRQIGPQLRADDPRSLKDMIAFLQQRFGPQREDARTGAKVAVMLDLISAVKNNKLRKGDALEHSAQFPWAAKVDAPLSASFAELVDDSFTDGRWWEGEAPVTGDAEASTAGNMAVEAPSAGTEERDTGVDLGALAASLRLNTDFRRALFAAIMTSASVTDAYERVERLGGLSAAKNRDRDTARVILHCCAAEREYNPFYALLAARMCAAARAMRFTFEHALCDMFRVVASGGEGGAKKVSRRKIRNYSQFVGGLLQCRALRLAVFKNVSDFDECGPQEKELYARIFEALLRAIRFEAKGDQLKVKTAVYAVFKNLPAAERDLRVPLARFLHTTVREETPPHTLAVLDLAVKVLQKNDDRNFAPDVEEFVGGVAGFM